MKIFTALLIIWSLIDTITGRLLHPRVTATSDDDIDIRLNPSLGNPTNQIIFERLVLFLYRDIFGNTKLYIPNGPKQASIEDLSKDADDIFLDVNSRKVKNIFNNNPYATWTIGSRTLVKPQINVKRFADEVEDLLTDDFPGLCDNYDNGKRPDVQNDQENNEKDDHRIVLPEIPKNDIKKPVKDENKASDAKPNDQSIDDKKQTPDDNKEINNDDNADDDRIVLPEIPVDNSDNDQLAENTQENRLVLPEIPPDHDKRLDVDDENGNRIVLPEILKNEIEKPANNVKDEKKESDAFETGDDDRIVLSEIPVGDSDNDQLAENNQENSSSRNNDDDDRIVLPEIPNDHSELNDDNRKILPDEPLKDRNETDSQEDENKNDEHRLDDNRIVISEVPETEPKPHSNADSIVNEEKDSNIINIKPIEHKSNGERIDDDEIVNSNKENDENVLHEISKNENDLINDNKSDSTREYNEKHQSDKSGEKDKHEHQDEEKRILPEIPTEDTKHYDQAFSEGLESVKDIKDYVPSVPHISDLLYKQIITLKEFLEFLLRKDNSSDDNENENNNGKGDVIIFEPFKELEEAKDDSNRQNGKIASRHITIVLPPINTNDKNEGESPILDPIPDSNEHHQHNENKPIILNPIEGANENGNFYLPEVPRHNDPQQNLGEENDDPSDSSESEIKSIVLPPILGDHKRDLDNDASEVNSSDDHNGNANKPNDKDEPLNNLAPIPSDAEYSENQRFIADEIQNGMEAREKTLHNVVDIIFKNLNLDNSKDFDAWLDKETKIITSEKSKEYSVLKKKIIEVLARNDLRVTEDKKLVDSYGQIVDPAEIKLRPIFIGPDGAFSRTDDGIKVEVPKGKSFLEAILILRSQQILGNIILGTTPPLEDCGGNDETASIEQISGDNTNAETIEAPNSNEKDKSESNIDNVSEKNIVTKEQEEVSEANEHKIQSSVVLRRGDYIDDDDDDENGANKIDIRKGHNNVGDENVYVNIVTSRKAAKVGANPVHANTIINLGNPKVNYQLLPVKEYDNAKIITLSPVRAKGPQPLVLGETKERVKGLHIHRHRNINNIKLDPRQRRFVNRVPARLAKNYGDDDEYLSNDEVTDRGVPMKKKVGFASEDYYYNRIIGGNTATGSGIPISNKGRLGLIR